MGLVGRVGHEGSSYPPYPPYPPYLPTCLSPRHMTALLFKEPAARAIEAIL